MTFTVPRKYWLRYLKLHSIYGGVNAIMFKVLLNKEADRTFSHSTLDISTVLSGIQIFILPIFWKST